MDNFMDNRWILRGIALLVTLLLFMSVNLVPQSSTSGLGDIPFVNNKELVKEVPVTPIYDQHNLIVTGIPKNVSVQLDGPNSIVKTAEMKKDFEVYLDLTSYALGTYEVPLKIRNISDKIKATIKPRTVRVTINEKIEKEVSVNVVYLNEKKIKHGYKAENAIVKPGLVTIVGSRDEVSQVAYASVGVDVTDANQTFSQVLPVKLYNKKGVQLPFTTSPRKVEVTVPIVSESASFPIKLVQTGTLKDGLKLSSLASKVNAVRIYASKDWLDKFNGPIEVPVDVSSFDQSGTYEVNVPTPNGAFRVDSSTINVDVNFDTEMEKKFSNIPINLVGENNQFEYKFIKPPLGKVVVTAKGFKDDLDAINPSDLNITAKVNGLDPGTRDVALTITGPKGVIYSLEFDTITIEITDKKSAQTDTDENENSGDVGQSSN
ncbi:YbbR-like domain-containing protein [Gottfriedia acidiceleris]|uniref:CdaR family protein n=1 Tax=Gottfriedia acidiceleris TaxID=371036 RepID=UPI00101B7B4F|nr:CdaR family protein [Gottfriedia acidiceleris]